MNLTLPAGPPDEVAAAAARGLRDGYSCFKVKVGLPDDSERVAAVREAVGSWPALRVDANGAWSAERAVAAIRDLAGYDLQLVEQPCRDARGAGRGARLAWTCRWRPTSRSRARPTCARAAELGACDAVNVKLAGSGGFGPARDALRAAREAGLGAWLSSTLDGPWGIAAALQLAAGERLSLACGLATLELFDAQLARALPGPAQRA